MRLIQQAHQMMSTAQALRRKGTTIGFVPTMGALHDGHLSLIRAARRHTRVAIVSIFVNPLQFGPDEDYARYPRDLKRDLNLAKASGAEIVFVPDLSQLYPTGFGTAVEVQGVSEQLEGVSRPGHFRGVATVVAKLFHLTQPTIAYFGQKDYQQTVVIQRMVKDLNLSVAIRVMPTVRESDGLAMSSRNVYLNPEERRQAAVIFRALTAAKAQIREGERQPERVREAMRGLILSESLTRIEYLALVNATTLKPLTVLVGRVAMLAAVRVGATRLIDNLLVDVS